MVLLSTSHHFLYSQYLQMVGLAGLEPAAYDLGDRRSIP